MTDVIKCPNCKRKFPVNRDKHLNRDVRYCPSCRQPIKVQRGFVGWKPNLVWFKKIAEERSSRKAKKKNEKLKRMFRSHITSQEMIDEYWKKQTERFLEKEAQKS